MATLEEIDHRVHKVDTSRTARRAAAARQVSQLAQRRAAIAEQLEAVEHELGDVLAAARDVIGVEELAEFTDLKAADLTQWLTGRRSLRGRRKKPTGGASRSRHDGDPTPATPPPAEGNT
jgi:hypothetical protein